MNITSYVQQPPQEYVFAAEIQFHASIFPWVLADVTDEKQQILLQNILLACHLSLTEVNFFKIGAAAAPVHTVAHWQAALSDYQPQTLFAFGEQAGSLFFKGEVLEKKWGTHQDGSQKIVYAPSLGMLMQSPHYKRQVWHDLAQSL